MQYLKTVIHIHIHSKAPISLLLSPPQKMRSASKAAFRTLPAGSIGRDATTTGRLTAAIGIAWMAFFSGCFLGPADSERMHPCEAAENCVYDVDARKSSCAEGFTWAEPDNEDNFNCVPENGSEGTCEPTTCLAQNAECGTLPDGCGGSVACGTCEAGLTCGAGGPNQCGVGSCEAITCAQAGAECGGVSDGCGNVVKCGTCASGFVCRHQATPPVCEEEASTCTPDTCASLNLSCGEASDGCGGTLNCGACSSCGNGVIDSGEACDGTQLGGASCINLGFDTGSLTCNNDCTLDQSQCQYVDCPPNSSFETFNGDGGCYCNDGYVVNAAGTGCEAAGSNNGGGGSTGNDGSDCSRPSYAFHFADPSSSRYSLLETDPGEAEIVIDSVTGYMVQKCMVGKSGTSCNEGDHVFMSSVEADAYCESLSMGGFDDWELLPMEILATMLDDRGVSNSDGIFRSSSFPNARVLPDDMGRVTVLLSGSLVPHDIGNMVEPRWGVNLATGEVWYRDHGVVRCARRTPEADVIQSTPRCITTHLETSCSESSFDLNVYCLRNHFEDSLTGLEWKRYEDRFTYGQSYEDQKEHCEGLSFGNGNWRLATYAELHTLADYSRPQMPYVNFANENAGGIYWTNLSSDPSSSIGQPRRKWKFWLSQMRFELQERGSNGGYGWAEAFCVREQP